MGTENETNDNDELSLSDEDSNCDMEDTAFPPAEHDDEGVKENDIFYENDEENNEIYFISEEWNWDSWVTIDDDEDIPGPPDVDPYDGGHSLKDGVADSFETVLACIFNTTAMDRDFFKRLAAQSNKYARAAMTRNNTRLYLGHKWENISVRDMVLFYGIMLRISMSPRKMGGYASYFQNNPVISLGGGYAVGLRGFEPWAKDIMSLVRFKQIRSAFHPEATATSESGDKCHQLRYFIRRFNQKAKEIFILGRMVSFDEGGIAMRSRFCPVQMYNKDKPAKFRVDFFILADAKYYFISHLDVYQGANDRNVDVMPSVKHLPTTQKAVANAILQSGIDNDVDGCRHIYMDNRYAAPQLLALMISSWNIRGVGTCKASRIGFDSEALAIDKKAERGSFLRLVDPRLGMVITRWRDSKDLQTVSTVMVKGIGSVFRQVGKDKIEVRCPNDIIMYQENMGGVDRGDQHRIMGAGFSNVAHFKKMYKKLI